MERNTGRSHNNQIQGQNRPNTSLIIVSEKVEHCYNAVINDYYEPIRKGIHNRVQEYKFGPGADKLFDIFKYIDQNS